MISIQNKYYWQLLFYVSASIILFFTISLDFDHWDCNPLGPQQLQQIVAKPKINTVNIYIATGVPVHPSCWFRWPQNITAPTISHAKLKIE